MSVNNNLEKLAKLVKKQNATLFLVGGAVRNELLNLPVLDYDICSELEPSKIEEICNKNNFKCSQINKKLGTLKIKIKDTEFEYTTLRQDVYDNTGKHTPIKVNFVTDLKTDCFRRDFSVNAIYKNILTGEVVDFCGGLKDLKNKTIKTVADPKIVFNDDGLRILRLVRFFSELNFKIDNSTFKTAKELSYNVLDIAKERVLKEINLTIMPDQKYGSTQGLNKIVKLFNKLNLWQFIFSQTLTKFKVKTSGAFYNAFLKSDLSNRYVAFMCNVLNSKNVSSSATIEFTANYLLGPQGLKDSNKNISDVVMAYTFISDLLNSKAITSNHCVTFKNLPQHLQDYVGLLNSKKFKTLQQKIVWLQENNIPFSVVQLKIDSTTLIEKLGVNPKHISMVRNTLYKLCVDGVVKNNLADLCEAVKKLKIK